MNDFVGRAVYSFVTRNLNLDLQKVQQSIDARKSVIVKIGPHTLRIYRQEPSNRWVLCWRDGTKRERFETTNPASAFNTASDILRAYYAGATLANQVAVERVQELLEADTALAGVNLHDLIRHYKENMAVHNRSVPDTLEELLNAAKEVGTSDRHRETIKSHLTRFKDAFSGSISAIRPTELDRYLARFENRKTRLNHRVSICALFHFAQRKGYLPAGLTAADKTERPKIVAQEPDIMSRSELETLLAACDCPLTKAFLLIGAFAGCRSAEIQRLKWGDIRENSIVLGPSITKTSRRRVAEMPPNLVEYLSTFRKSDSEYVTFPPALDHMLYRRVRALCKRVGLQWKPNALRHTFVSCHLELHRDPPRTAKTSGHSLAILERSYLKLVDRTTAEQWFEIRPLSHTNNTRKEPETCPTN